MRAVLLDMGKIERFGKDEQAQQLVKDSDYRKSKENDCEQLKRVEKVTIFSTRSWTRLEAEAQLRSGGGLQEDQRRPFRLASVSQRQV